MGVEIAGLMSRDRWESWSFTDRPLGDVQSAPWEKGLTVKRISKRGCRCLAVDYGHAPGICGKREPLISSVIVFEDAAADLGVAADSMSSGPL